MSCVNTSSASTNARSSRTRTSMTTSPSTPGVVASSGYRNPAYGPHLTSSSTDPEIDKLADIATGTRGSHDFVLAAPSAIAAGDIVQLQWINRTGPDAGIVRSLYESAYQRAGSHHWSFPERPLVRQTSRVVAVDGTTVRLADPLLHDVGPSIPAQVARWDGLEHVGVEELHLEFPDSPYFGHHMERGYNGIYFTTAFDSWARSIRVTNADSGILSYSSANITYRDIVSTGTRRAGALRRAHG